MGVGGDSLGCSTCKIVSSVNRDNFTSPFPIECLFFLFLSFFSFSCLVALARTSISILTRSGENVHPGHERKTCSLSY